MTAPSVTDDPYRDPALYDLEYGYKTDDVVFYTDLARRVGGPVAELGCGNGRILIPIARAGVAIHGLDNCDAMLEDLGKKLRAESLDVQRRATWHRGDFASVTGPCGLVIWAFNALHHVPGPDALVDTLTQIRGAVREDGVLALDCYLPDQALYARGRQGRHGERDDVHPLTGEALLSWEESWWDAEARVHHVMYVWQHADGREDRQHLALQMYDLEELRALISRAGFRVEREAEDFSGTPVTDASLKWVAELRLG